jgi:hypothetical protein
VCSASGADKEEQGQEAEEEGACCVECIPVDTLRTLISPFDKAVIIIRWGYAPEHGTNAYEYTYIHMPGHVRRYAAMPQTCCSTS